jgi:hypothetical protein
MFDVIRCMWKCKRGDLEFDELGKLILGLVLLVVLIIVVSVVIKGELWKGADRLRDVFSFFK